MNVDLVLRCPACQQDALANDEFCESCGFALGVLRDAHRNHIELETASAAGLSDRGLVHRRNEDALFLDSAGASTVAVVCDGVSTSVAPQVAAETAATIAGSAVVAAARDTRSWEARRVLVDAVAAANSAVLDVPWMAQPGGEGPSCTIVAAVWDGAVISLTWTGDSRAYWVTDSAVQQLTSDHSWAQEQIDAGKAEPDEALSDPRAHAITRWLGPDAPASAPPTGSVEPDAAGWLILCTDGLWNHLESIDELGAVVRTVSRDRRPLEIVRALASLAIARGGTDNVTVAVIEVTPSQSTDEEELTT